jgi:hypothetical protein
MRASRRPVAIFLDVFWASQNLAISVVFLLLGGGVLLTIAPYEVGTIRLAGVSLLWWYGLVVAPVVTVAVTTGALFSASRRRAIEDATPPPAAE